MPNMRMKIIYSTFKFANNGITMNMNTFLAYIPYFEKMKVGSG
jgi:hypothetical protein